MQKLPDIRTRADVESIVLDLGISAADYASVLSHYTTMRRIRALHQLMKHDTQDRNWTHRKLAWVVCASREKVTTALGILRSTEPAIFAWFGLRSHAKPSTVEDQAA